MGRGKFKGKPTGRRNFSTPEEIAAGTSGRPRTFKKKEEEEEEEEEEREESEEESEDESDEKPKLKGTEGIIQIENPNLVKARNIKAKEVDVALCSLERRLNSQGVKVFQKAAFRARSGAIKRKATGYRLALGVGGPLGGHGGSRGQGRAAAVKDAQGRRRRQGGDLSGSREGSGLRDGRDARGRRRRQRRRRKQRRRGGGRRRKVAA
nr:unnamed protein product [Digitaria exilis]